MEGNKHPLISLETLLNQTKEETIYCFIPFLKIIEYIDVTPSPTENSSSFIYLASLANRRIHTEKVFYFLGIRAKSLHSNSIISIKRVKLAFQEKRLYFTIEDYNIHESQTWTNNHTYLHKSKHSAFVSKRRVSKNKFENNDAKQILESEIKTSHKKNNKNRRISTLVQKYLDQFTPSEYLFQNFKLNKSISEIDFEITILARLTYKATNSLEDQNNIFYIFLDKDSVEYLLIVKKSIMKKLFLDLTIGKIYEIGNFKVIKKRFAKALNGFVLIKLTDVSTIKLSSMEEHLRNKIETRFIKIITLDKAINYLDKFDSKYCFLIDIMLIIIESGNDQSSIANKQFKTIKGYDQSNYICEITLWYENERKIEFQTNTVVLFKNIEIKRLYSGLIRLQSRQFTEIQSEYNCEYIHDINEYKHLKKRLSQFKYTLNNANIFTSESLGKHFYSSKYKKTENSEITKLIDLKKKYYNLIEEKKYNEINFHLKIKARVLPYKLTQNEIFLRCPKCFKKVQNTLSCDCGNTSNFYWSWRLLLNLVDCSSQLIFKFFGDVAEKLLNCNPYTFKKFLIENKRKEIMDLENRCFLNEYIFHAAVKYDTNYNKIDLRVNFSEKIEAIKMAQMCLNKLSNPNYLL